MKNKWKRRAFWIGISIVVLTHIYLLIAGLPSSQVVSHSILNLVGAGLLAYALF